MKKMENEAHRPYVDCYLAASESPKENLLGWWKSLTHYGEFLDRPCMMIGLRKLTSAQIEELENYNRRLIRLHDEKRFFDASFVAARRQELEIIRQFKQSLHVSR